MAGPGYWERTSTQIVEKLVQELSCRSWKELQKELNRHGRLFHSGASWPTKMWQRGKRKVLDGTAWGLRLEPPPRTHTEAVDRMLKLF